MTRRIYTSVVGYLVKMSCVVALALAINTPASARDILTGTYGLWAVDNIEASLKILSQNNFKLVSGLEGRTFLDMSNKYGLKCLVGFRSGLTKEITENEGKWNDYLIALKAYVNDLKAHPAVYAWYLVDEPDLSGISTDKIRTLVTTVRLIDKSHPIYTVLYGQGVDYRKYIQYFDIIGIEPYLHVNDKNVNIVKTMIDKVRTDIGMLKLRRKLFVVLGAFDLKPRPSQDSSTLRKPTVAEFNQMLSLCSDANVDGVLIYTLAFKNNSTYYDWNLARDDINLWTAVKKMPEILP